MFKDGKYRYSLGFGGNTEKERRVGELLERLGNRKSSLIVDVLSEYIDKHPELENTHGKIEIKITASPSAHSKEKIEQMHAAGIENIMALRGDLTPELEKTDRSTWAYRHAVDLIHDIKNSGYGFCIGGACYPEIHPESANQKDDIKYLKEKVDAGCDFLTTQMFFDNNLLYNFLYKIREAGITVPIIPGVMPITNGNQVERAITLSGSFMPQRFKSIVDKFGNSPAAMKQAGIAYATDQIIDLFANGITNVHVYSMNKPDVAAEIQRNLSDILG